MRPQIKLENVTRALEKLGRRINYPPQSNSSIWKCPLGRENDGAAKAKMIVNKEDFLAVLARHPVLVQRLCAVYIQDYVCLGFSLPRDCEWGRELSWLEAPTHGRGRHSERGISKGEGEALPLLPAKMRGRGPLLGI